MKTHREDSLLISLGTSWAIVPEAFLLPDTHFTSVHVLTTASEMITEGLQKIQDWFLKNAPGVALTITRVEGFSDLNSEDDHFTFEEALYRWMLAVTPGGNAHVCLSGGFKTMSAAVQKAAAVLGAREVFHVLCSSNPSTADGIETAKINGDIHWIRLGAESRLPQLSAVTAADFPLETVREDGAIRHVRCGDRAFRGRLREIVERSHRIAASWSRLPSLPFNSLATWPAANIAWLDEPLDPVADEDWVRALPKVELHCHLGGFATHGVLLREVRAAAHDPARLPDLAEPRLPDGWPRPSQPIALDSYMALGDASGRVLLKDPGCLQRQIELLYGHLVSQNVAYAEIRCSPNNYADAGRGRSAWDVLGEIRHTFQKCMDSAAAAGGTFCHVNLLIIATRKNGGDRSDISRHLALAITAAQHWASGCRIVGVDLAGFENRETRAALFQTDFEPVHRVGLSVTCHAGENDDAEGIWQAVFKLNARRLGHALHLGNAPDLLRAVADRGIGIEMCPFANFQIKGFSPMVNGPSYPMIEYLRAGIPVTVNTDNIGISAASLSDNLLLLPRLCPGISRLDLLRMLANAVSSAFVPPTDRDSLRRLIGAQLAPP